ncbi:MAG: hypothetical protein AMXMBFR57_34340 [Acidimicrobiia bacterium]
MLKGFDQIDKQEGGATFVTADLHVHSFGFSSDVKDPGMTVEAIIDAAVAKGLSILSITDHNNDGQVLRSLEHGARFGDALLVLPGVEVSTAHGHLLVYCDPQNPDVITTLLAKIDLKGPKGGRDTHTSRSMADVIAIAHDLGAICIAAHIDRDKSGFEALTTGYPNWKKDIITSKGLFGLDFDSVNNLAWFSPEDAGSDAAGQRRALLQERTGPELGAARLAAVQNSDAHTLGAFNSNAQLSRYKMNGLSFEGFRTSLIDSEARVRVVSTVPTSIPRILGLQLFGGFVDGGCYRFSPNLNCFIGGRGTGKSTVIQSIGYAVGAHTPFEHDDNCADSTVVFCEDANGVRYRYERQRRGGWTVSAEDQHGKGIEFEGTFRVEFYKQGHLAEVAKDPMRNPELLQAFLDQHLELSDALADEKALVQELEHNSAQLKPLEAGFLQIAAKEKQAQEIDQKLKAAEEGKLKDVAAAQGRIGAEKAFIGTLKEVAKDYTDGVSLDVAKRDYAALRDTAGEFTDDSATSTAFRAAEAVINTLNAWLEEEQKRINERLAAASADLTNALTPIPGRHAKWEERIAAKIDELRKQGLSGSIAQLSSLITQRKQLTADLTRLNAQRPQLAGARTKRTDLIDKLSKVRNTLTARRKAQVSKINAAFKATIDDYSVYLFYKPGGIRGEFVALVAEVMNGSFMQEKDIEKLCAAITPLDLAKLVRAGDASAIGQVENIGLKWGSEIVRRFRALEYLHRLEIAPQPPSPVIKVLTKTTPAKEIPVGQLSDGQKHTILLAIALLGDSNEPLIIDQPEDDLDNAFIFSSVVRTLRYIKERRQVFIVTHNANIAVLGDSEIIFPMRRDGGVGKTYERGAIDRVETKRAVQNVLEGGPAAFLKRKAIYGIE